MGESNILKVVVVAGAVIHKDGKYLLVQEKQPAAFELWNFPAGKVELGDTLTETAIREAKEETGFDVEIISEIGVYHNEGEKAVKHAYEAGIIGGSLQFSKDELLDARWFTLDEIMAMKDKLRDPWILEAIGSLKK